MKNLFWLVAALMLACAGEAPEETVELGEVEQAVSLATAPQTGNYQIFGTSGGYMQTSCSSQQLASTTCYVIAGDPVFSVNNQRWMGILLGSNWSGGALTYATNAFNQITVDMPTNSADSFGALGVNFYTPTGGDVPEILIDNTDLPTTQAAQLETFVKAIPFGTITTLTEPTPMSGTWKMATRCRVQIDYNGIVNDAVPYLNAHGQPNSQNNLQALVKQAMGFGILKCLGIGQTNGPVVINNMPYSHREFSWNVQNNSRYFTRLERCLLRRSCVQDGCTSDTNVTFGALNQSALNGCGPD